MTPRNDSRRSTEPKKKRDADPRMTSPQQKRSRSTSTSLHVALSDPHTHLHDIISYVDMDRFDPTV